jgi:hypothetical protein
MSSIEGPRLVSIWGPPRSGTTWLGQIFDSHPAVAYRFQPLFSYRFKSAVNAESPAASVRSFLAELLATDDDFVLQSTKRSQGLVPRFEKSSPSSHLAFKEVRYIHLAGHFLATVPESCGVGIIRHPCATINSWLKTPREFLPSWNRDTEWRDGHSKNLGRIEEYHGFERWQWCARSFLHLAHQYPTRFSLVQYEKLVRSPAAVVSALFARCGLEVATQTMQFLRASQAEEVDHPDSIFRKPDVADRWREELPADICHAIVSECRGTVLEQFCQ